MRLRTHVSHRRAHGWPHHTLKTRIRIFLFFFFLSSDSEFKFRRNDPSNESFYLLRRRTVLSSFVHHIGQQRRFLRHCRHLLLLRLHVLLLRNVRRIRWRRHSCGWWITAVATSVTTVLTVHPFTFAGTLKSFNGTLITRDLNPKIWQKNKKKIKFRKTRWSNTEKSLRGQNQKRKNVKNIESKKHEKKN